MTFIGIISNNKTFENVKEIVNKNSKEDIKLIAINKKNINNMKNIKFQIIVIEENMEKFKEEILIIRKICYDAKFVAINTDINTRIQEFVKKSSYVITYGLNQKATVTISSIKEENILIYVQKKLKNEHGNIVEIGEELIKLEEKNKFKIYEILIIYVIFLIKSDSIIHITLEKSNFFE